MPFQARYAKLCFNEYNTCQTRQILQKEAKSMVRNFDPENKNRTELNVESTSQNMSPQNDDSIMLDEAQPEGIYSNHDARNIATRGRILINPDYVASLDESDGSKPYNDDDSI